MELINFSNRKRMMSFVLGILGLIVLWFILQAYTAINYSNPNAPYFAGNFATENLQPVETLTVVSYNISFGQDIAHALSEMKEIQAQNGLDIILLQEMDEIGTEQIARALKMHYVYFPAAIEPTYHKNFGNAILSRWLIMNAQKLILPHKSFSNRMNRIATKATIFIPGTNILVYSLHTESVFTWSWYRKEQYTTVLEDVDPKAKLVIVGGDFNSFTQSAVQELEVAYKQAGFVRVSKGSGATVDKLGIEMTPDHIFAKGFIPKETGKLATATASDHFPVWVTLSLKSEQN